MTFEQKTSAIYVLYPRGSRTGGPEALHQLVDSLRRQGANAFLVPTQESRDLARVPDYRRYDAPEVLSIVDSPSSVVVTHETRLFEILGLKYARACIWWLSVDNSPAFSLAYALRRRVHGPQSLGRIGKLIVKDHRRRKTFRENFGYLQKRVGHLVQSDYAAISVRRKYGVVPFLLSDYLGGQTDVSKVSYGERGGVAYNPNRGQDLVRRLVRLRPDIDWIPIAGMSPTEVDICLAKASIYIDLGHHPGKDRMPREAARAGAVVLSSRQGAARSFVDMPLADEYKIDLNRRTRSVLNEVSGRIDCVLAGLDYHRENQSSYRAAIACQHATFDDEVRALMATWDLV